MELTKVHMAHTHSHFNFPAQLWQGTQINVNSFRWFNVKYDSVDWAFNSSLPRQAVCVDTMKSIEYLLNWTKLHCQMYILGISCENYRNGNKKKWI